MAKSDIIASLKLNSTDYEQKLAKAKKNTQSFAQGGMSDFAKLATAIAGSKAAMEVFNRVIASSQTIGDKYAQTMHTARSAVDQFVYSIANADFSRFNMGLSDIITKSREAYNALDQLGNTQISYNYMTGKNRAALRENLLKVRDVNLPMSEREAALQTAQGLYADIQQQTSTYKATTEKYIKAALAEVSGLMAESIQMDDFVSALMVDIGADPAAARAVIEKQYKVYKDEAAKISAYGSRTKTNEYGQLVANANYDPERAKADTAALNESNRSLLVAYNLLFRYTDEELQKLTGYLTQADNASYAVGEFATQIREAGNSLNQPIKPGTVGAALIDPSQYKPQGLGTMAGIPTGSSASALPASLPEVPVVMNQITESSYTAVDGVYALSSAMSSLSGAVGEGAGAWLDWSANLLSAIAQAIPAIAALTTAKNAEATANTAAAATGAGSAVANIPVVGPIMAVAAIASVIAALTKLPKFATGGVVPGNALSGDNVLIRANSGEVVLTKSQANNIGSLISGGIGGIVKFKIEGGDLVGVLNNHNSITSRSYGH